MKMPIIARRLPAQYQSKVERTLYSKCVASPGAREGLHTHAYTTTLYADEQCTEEVFTLSWASPRILKDGVFRLREMYGTFQQYVYVVVIDNGVNRIATTGQKFKYQYDKKDE